ncbi:MAG: IS5 family transposase [Geminicoccaceae bacterium]
MRCQADLGLAMSLKMNEDDWAVTLEVFRSNLPARGAKAKDDRLFLEALHFSPGTASPGGRCRSGSASGIRCGSGSAGWARPVYSTIFFAMLAGLSETAHLVQMFDSTVVRAHVSAAGAKGGQAHQALGRSRGGFSTKMHVKTDFDGLPNAFELTGGEAADSPMFETLLDTVSDHTYRAVVADKGYDSDANRELVRKRGAVPVIPYRRNRKAIPGRFGTALYRGRARIEQAVGKLKRLKRIPRFRSGSYFPSFPEPRRSVEKALTTVIQ